MKISHYILTSLLLLVSVSLSAQDLYNKGASITITSNTIFSVEGMTVNDGTITNNGNFVISGAWFNNGTYNPGIGDFTLNSASDQIVNHNAQSFQRLVISGGGRKIFQADLSIEDQLDLQDGILLSENEARLIVDDGAEIIGGSANAYIIGALYQFLDDEKTYPIGTTTQYLPVTLSAITATNLQLGIAAISPNPLDNFEEEILAISPDYAWELNALQGTLDEATITLPIRGQDFFTTIDDVVVVVAEGSNAYRNIGQFSSTGDVSSGTLSAELFELPQYVSLGVTGDDFTPGINVYNAVTPGSDGKHDFLHIDNITFYPENSVQIFNRWGDAVFEMLGYNNNDKVFDGTGNVNGNKIVDDGTYYYVIKYGADVKTGFFILKR